MGFSLVVESGDHSVVLCRLLIASPVVQHRLEGPWAAVFMACSLQSVGSVVAVYGLSCSKACGIFLDQGLN